MEDSPPRPFPGANLPKLFYVNWFRKNDDGNFIWPGFGENARVLKWVLERIGGTTEAVETAIGMVPKPEDLDVSGLDLKPEELQTLLAVNEDEWKSELTLIEEHYESIGERLPNQMRAQLSRLSERLAG